MKKIKASKWIEKSDGVKLIDQFRQIASINYACQATNILEKILWATIFLIGMLYAIYFTAQMFDGNSSIISRIDIKLSDLNYPAMTICPLGSTKYAIAERLGNYLNPDNLPLEWHELRKMLFDYIALQRQHDWSDERLKDEFASKCGYGLCEV